jgi:hypothetical protein
MFDNLSTNNKKALIKLKETFVFLKRECDRINQKIYFMKEILLSMITNLTYCNNILFVYIITIYTIQYKINEI